MSAMKRMVEQEYSNLIAESWIDDRFDHINLLEVANRRVQQRIRDLRTEIYSTAEVPF